MHLLSIETVCDTCETVFGLLVDSTTRNDKRPCTECEGTMSRLWSVPHVSTEKTSESIPDVVAKGRFKHLATKQEMRKEVSKAKKRYVADPSSGNADEVKRAKKEYKEIK